MPDGKSESDLWPANKNWKCEGCNLIGVTFFLVVCVNFVVLVCLFVCLFWSAINAHSVVSTFYLFPFQERTSEDSKEVESFQQLLTARIQEFVEEV